MVKWVYRIPMDGIVVHLRPTLDVAARRRKDSTHKFLHQKTNIRFGFPLCVVFLM